MNAGPLTALAGRARTRIRRHPWWFGTGGAIVAIATLTWTLWPTPTAAPPPRARQYLNFTACLLTGEHGIAEADAAPVWAGMQDASLSTRAKVQYLAVTGPQTTDNAMTFVGSLAQTSCDIIFAAGPVQVAAVTQAAGTFPKAKFYTVGTGSTRNNISPVPGTTPTAIRAAVNHIVTTAINPPST